MRKVPQTVLVYGAAAAVFVGFVCLAAAVGQQLIVVPAGDEFHVSAPQMHFLIGKPVERLRNGNVVPFDFQLSVLSDQKTAVLRRSFERFVFSYDLWEEKYTVTRLRSQRAQASHLTAQAAEAWCIERMEMPTGGLPPDEPLWLRLEVRSPDPKEREVNPDDGMSLKALIELFSLASRSRQPQYWRAEAGPLRLVDLRRIPSLRGAD